MLNRRIAYDQTQIVCLRTNTRYENKGITFNYTTEKDSYRYLAYSTYYFKLKSYSKNYDKYLATTKKGQYINLDFAYLQELFTLDTYLRKIIISMALDVEHALKTQLLLDLSQNDSENGYDIVQKYLDADYMRVKSLHDKLGNFASSDLIQKKISENTPYALWEIVEILSFGEFIDLYQLFYSTYLSKDNNFSSYLWSIKFLRNAAAHNNCLDAGVKRVCKNTLTYHIVP